MHVKSQENGRSATGGRAKLTDLETIGRQRVKQSSSDRRAEIHRRRIGRKVAGERITHECMADHLMLRTRMQNGLRIVVSRKRKMPHMSRRDRVRLELFGMGNGRQQRMRRRRDHDMPAMMRQMMTHQAMKRVMWIRVGKMRQQREQRCQQGRQNEHSLLL